MKYIDVTRASNTSLDVMLEENIDDYWNVDGDRELSDMWTGFTKFTVLNEKPLDGCSCSGVTDKKTSRPDTLWPWIWKVMSDASKRKEKQKRAIEKPELDNARKLRCVYFIDLDDGEFQEIVMNARRKLEVPMPAAMLCKIQLEVYRENCRVRIENAWKEPLLKDHEDHIAGKGMNSLNHYNLVHKFILMLQAMKVPDTKAAVEKEWEKLEKIPAWHLTKVRNKNEVIAEARSEGR